MYNKAVKLKIVESGGGRKGTAHFAIQNNNSTLFHDRAAAAAVAAHTSTGKCCAHRTPPPLLRSRTLPAIIVPGISILQTQLNPSRQPVGGMYPSNLVPALLLFTL